MQSCEAADSFLLENDARRVLGTLGVGVGRQGVGVQCGVCTEAAEINSGPIVKSEGVSISHVNETEKSP